MSEFVTKNPVTPLGLHVTPYGYRGAKFASNEVETVPINPWKAISRQEMNANAIRPGDFHKPI